MTNPRPNRIEFHMGALLSGIRSNLAPFGPKAQNKYIAEIKEQVEAGLAQARNDTFDLVRDALKSIHENDRWTFLQYCLTGWIESGATGFLITQYDAGLSNHDLIFSPGLPEGTERREAKVTAINQGDEFYDADAVAMILRTGKVCSRCGAPLENTKIGWRDWAISEHCYESKPETHEPEQAVFEVTHETIELGLQRVRDALDAPDIGEGTGNWEKHQTTLPGLGQGLRNAIIQADLTNDSTQLDAWGYAAIVEIALLGDVVYA